MHREFRVFHTRCVIKDLRKTTVFSIVCFLWVFCFVTTVQAQELYRNPDTGYVVVIEDDANLLTDSEEAGIQTVMQDITAYGNVALKTILENNATTEHFVKNYYSQQFGSDSGTVFLIDMDNRNIWIHSDGAVYRMVSDSYALTITDNVYTYASDADYYNCCYMAFEQMFTLLQGKKIAQPMKYTSNAFFAIVLALLLNYFVVRIFSATRKPSDKELLEGLFVQQEFTNFNADYTHSTKEYSPQSSGSGGGGRSGGGGGGGGGGGHSF